MVSDASRHAFDEFVRTRTPALARTAYLLTGDAHLAEDLVQTALFKAARAWHRIEGDPEPYVRRILYTQNVSWWRRRKVRETSLGSYDDAAPSRDDSDLRLSLESALARLTERQRTVLVLRFFEDLTEVQTASVLGIGAGTVKIDDSRGAGPAAGRRAPSRGAAGGGVMTGGQLKDELTRIAEGAPTVHVADDLFARGRRATTRARVLVGAAAVACIALIAAVAAPLVLRDDTPVADREGTVGVPDTIYAPPDADTSNLRSSPIEEVGPAVAAYLVDTLDGRIVVVTREGRYVRSRLPNYKDAAVDEVSPALSPDGTQLAWTSRHDGAPALSVVDLATGETRHVQLAAPYGATVRTMQWSPDSQWLVWSGQAVEELRANGASYRAGIIGGVIARDSTDSRSVPGVRRDEWDGAGVCNDGTVLTYGWPKFARYDGEGRSLSRSWADTTAGHGACAAPATYLTVGDERDLIGWLPQSGDQAAPTAVTLVPEYDDDSGIDSYRLELVAPGGDATTVGTVESSWVENLSLATGLMSADRPTVPAGESPWAPSWWEEHRSDLFILAVFVAAPCLLFLFVRRRLRK